MYGHQGPFRPGGGGRGAAQPPQHQQIHLNPNLYPNPNLFLLQQNPNFVPHFNPFLQNPNSFPQNQPQFINNSVPIQPNSDINDAHTPRPSGSNNSKFRQKEMVDKLDKAVVKAVTDLLESSMNVSSWKVSQAALLMVKAESWESLGFQMQQVPSLNNLLVMEGKINAFIHCFVAVRRITSLYDLEVAICESEGIEGFEELGLGPLVRHPLAVHYFSVTSDVIEVYRIRTEEIISYLCEFIDTRNKKEIKVDTFLDFICKKQSVSGREKLCVRVQNFGLYISHIRKAMQTEDGVLKKCYEKMKSRSAGRCHQKRRLFAAQKKEMDDHFTAISQSMKSFSSSNTQFCGKHVRFTSSGSDDDSEANEYDENQDEKNTESNCGLPLTNCKSDRVSRCPYPSATEEMTRLGFKSEVEPGSCRHGGSVRCNADNDLPTRKRKYENMSCSTSLPRNRNKKNIFDLNLKSTSSGGLPLSAESLRMFITTWKETCRENNADEVIERMLQFYNTRKKRRVKELFTIYPFVGLLYAAVAYIKSGIWDNIYDTFQTFNQKSMDDKPSESSADYISIDVEPSEKDVAVSAPKYLAHKHNVRAEDIVKKISGYFEDDILSYKTPYRENCLHFLRKLCKCEYWLIEQYSINKFESLGYGEYLMFLEKYMHMLPHALQKRIIGDISENVSLEAHLLPVQLDVLLSQASNSLWQNEVINMRNISELLARQFPLVSIKLVNSDRMADFTKRCSITSNSVLFSTPLSRLNYTGDSSVENKKTVEETRGFANNRAGREGMIEAVTTKDAIEILLKAPMMIDLNLWSHWDMLFAPSLGSIVEWLLKEVNTKELLCMITKDGKVIRIDHSATMDSFLEVFIRGSSFETAVQLLSLFALYGGERNVPLSLLKCHARKAFGVIINNYLEKELSNDMNPLRNKNPFYDKSIFGNSTSSDLVSKLSNNRSILNRAAPVMSKFILDCLSYLPIEFCSFAADVLIAGLQSFVNDVPAAILTECKKLEQLLMLHEVGMSLGLMEWVRDYQSFCSSPRTGFSLGSSCLDVVHSGFSTRSVTGQGELDKHPASLVKTLVSSEVDHHNLRSKGVSGGADSAKVSVDSRAANSKLISKVDIPIDYDPAKVIESIRQEEFGLDQSLSATKNSMLEKQHARLGRALHCLSHELYSQDSHFLLELVQNADDNIYLEHVEPTLTFILQDRGIIVLNNEVGFSANNIRALCDVGNSTKKGHSTGYIGKKGIGFKSVFRVTDAPEIHSNGFHIKFDITEGQVGFVLPTVVPPCDMDLYTRLASADDDCQDQDAWNTCIVLPFRSDMLGGFAMNNILSMFSDLHPSLLLFLHRLHCIKFRNLIDGSLSVMRKEVIGDGIVEVTLGNEKMTWFVVSHELNCDVIRSDVETTEISIAFTLQEMYEGGSVPILNQQPVFAFLPLRTYGLKFILQGDFVLPSSREEVDGNSPWNQWLLSEFPNLFVSAERSFCALPCYRGCPGKAITVFMSFIPLVGEVHGFFSSLPRMIVSKLRMSECLIQEGAETEWIAPCKALRNWTDQTRSLIPDNLLHEHLGLRFLSKDITLSDSLANALGVEDYGPQILLRVISSLCRSENGLQSMGLSWLSSWLSTFYVISSQFFMQNSLNSVAESDLLDNLRKIPFIPLSDGKYSSFGEDSIWLHSEAVAQGINDECLLKAFPELYAKLRIVSPNLLAAATSIESSCSDLNIVENVTRMLYKVGIQRLSVHDIVKVHILPALSEGNIATGQEKLVIEYLAFAMYHLQSSCTICSLERSRIIAELHEKAMILTNYGFKRPSEVPIHFNQEFGNPVDVNKLISGLDLKWHEIDTAYVKHPVTKSMSGGVLKWRSFFQELGVTDFVQVVQIEKSVPDVSPTNSEDVIGAKEMISTGIITKNWESSELFHLLSSLSSRDVWDKSKYLLEILDRLWDDNFGDKVTGYCVGSSGERKPFKSSFISILQDSPWIVSNIDTKLHCPQDLFHDCLAVKTVLGVSAPYTIPKVSSEKMLADLGFKTQVTPDDALSVLRLWRKSKSPFRASVSQMSNFYSFLWKEMTLSKNKIIEELHSGPFIFLPNTSSFSEEDLIHGALLSPHEVYWHDTIGTVNQIKSVHPVCVSSTRSSPQRKMLYNFYPNLHDFFVNECGVDERPPFCSYLQILLELSTIALPHQAAKKVFEVFIMWDDALKTGSLSFEDAEYLKESLLKKEYTVLPTRQDKWVSLHSSFGLVCWCDDDDLGTEFRDLEGVDFLHFGEPTDEKNRMLQAKVSTIMKRLGIPALSEVVTREAIYYGPADCSLVFSLVNWALPYAQRYIYNAHPDIYSQLKQSDFENIRHLKIVVVEKLFHRNVIKKYEITSKSRHSCNCLLQDKILYCTRESDQHSIFLEFSCLLSMNGTPDLHFANFLLMITRMAESGSTEEQTELFILNSQKVPKLPADESIWSLQSASSIEDHATPPENSLSLKVEEQRSSAVKRKTGVISNWPPVDWKTAPGFDSSSSFGFKKPGNKIFAEKNIEQSDMSIAGISSEFNMEVDSKGVVQEGVILEAEILETQSNNSTSLVGYSTNMVLDSVDLFTSDGTNFLTTNSTERDQVFAQQAQLTGRLGELVASKFFMGKFGEASVNWVNENSETGLPYDILLGDDENTREYIEVKATRSARKNWFLISMREWQFAIEKGESFSIAHVVLADENMAKVTVYKNPARLCQLGNLKLAFVVPK